MGCIEKIYSVSALTGNGTCNGHCSFCAGRYLRPQAKDKDDPLYERNLESAIKLSARYGGWSLSLTSSGEPACDPNAVTRALQIYRKCANDGAFFPNVNLFTNGILLGDSDFCNKYLDEWRKLGLTNIAVSIHEPTEEGQARTYGLDKYPKFADILKNVQGHGIGVRATLLLRKNGVDTVEKYKSAVETLISIGFDNITSWAVGNPDGSRNEFTPSKWNLFKIQMWLRINAKSCHSHAWGGGVYDYKGNILRYTDYVTKHDPKKDYIRQLVVFQDGTVAYSWIREGALCMK